MKRFLLLLTTVLVVACWASAGTASWTFNGTETTGDNGTWTANPQTNVNKGYGGLALGKKDNGYTGTLTLSGSDIPADATINSVTLKCNGGKKGTSYTWNVIVNGQTATNSASLSCSAAPASNGKLNAQEITIDQINLLGNDIVIDFAKNNGGHTLYIWSITIDYSTYVGAKPVEAFTATPAADSDNGIYVVKGSEVTFTAANAAKIGYTFNEETAEKEGDQVAFTINEESTVQLWAYDSKGEVKQTADYFIYIKEAPLCGQIVFDPAAGEVYAGTEVNVSCENAVRYEYMVETGSELSDAVNVDAATFSYSITEACTLHVVAYNADGKSVDSEAAYTVKAVPDENNVEFDFTSASIADYASKTIVASSGTKDDDANNLNGVTLTKSGVYMTFDKANASNHCRWWKYASNGTELRTYKLSTITIGVPAGTVITKVVFEGSKVNYTVTTGSFSNGVWTPIAAEPSAMRAESTGVNQLVFTNSESANSVVNKITVSYEASTQTSIENVAVEGTEASVVEYFDLQGRRVANPADGIYIRRCGNSVTKVVF